MRFCDTEGFEFFAGLSFHDTERSEILGGLSYHDTESEAPLTLQKIFGTGSDKNGTRTQKKWFSSGKFCNVKDFAVQNVIPAEPKFHPCSVPLKR